MTPKRAAIAAGEKQPITLLGWVRIVLRVLALLLLLLTFVPLHYLYRIFAYGSPFPKYFLKFATRICGARAHRHGTALKRDVVFLSNHVSWLDILTLAGESGTAFVSKAELKTVPIVGWLASLNRTVYIQREARRDVADQINAVREAMEDNWSVTIFPEGTTTDGQSLLPFKTPLLKMLEPPPPGVMVQPVVMDYGALAEDIGWIGDETGLHNALRVLSRPGTFPVKLFFLEPFDPDECAGRKAIGAKARQMIEAKLLERLGKPLRDYRLDAPPVRYEGTGGN